jgi:transcriptional regulator with XRE-family HTH domain
MGEINGLGDRLAQARAAAGLTQAEFGAAMGISGERVSQVERGMGNLSRRNLKLAADTLGVEVLWLYSGEGSMRAAAVPSGPAPVESWDLLKGVHMVLRSTLLRRGLSIQPDREADILVALIRKAQASGVLPTDSEVLAEIIQ